MMTMMIRWLAMVKIKMMVQVMMAVVLMTLLILKFKTWHPTLILMVTHLKLPKTYLGNFLNDFCGAFSKNIFLRKPNDEKCGKQNQGSDWSEDDWNDGSGSGLSDR